MKTVYNSTVLFAVNSADGAPALYTGPNYDEMIIKQISMSDLNLATHNPVYYVRIKELGLNIGTTVVGGNAYPNLRFDIKGRELPTTWTFEIRTPANAVVTNADHICVSIEFIKYLDK
jgi:hypothetical protein